MGTNTAMRWSALMAQGERAVQHKFQYIPAGSWTLIHPYDKICHVQSIFDLVIAVFSHYLQNFLTNKKIRNPEYGPRKWHGTYFKSSKTEMKHISEHQNISSDHMHADSAKGKRHQQRVKFILFLTLNCFLSFRLQESLWTGHQALIARKEGNVGVVVNQAL